MVSEGIHPEFVMIALDRAEGFVFERFAQDFLAVLVGKNFIPVGGNNDGGADGIYDGGNGRSFYQFTIQENHRDKIRKTVKRLKEVGRNVTSLYYLSPRLIPRPDLEEDLLTEELEVFIKIRDRKYISSHINDAKGTILAFQNHLATYTQFLGSLTSNSSPAFSSHIQNPAAYVFLQHEVTNRLGNRKLIHSLADTMILWALSDTDPDRDIFMQESEIEDQIFSSFPWASKVLEPHIHGRLKTLRNKSESGREIRWYRKEEKYCLPFETRNIIAYENSYDESLKIQFLEELKLTASEAFDDDGGAYKLVAEMGMRVVHLVFERQGLLFAHFLNSDEDDQAPPVVVDCIDQALEERNLDPGIIENYRDYLELLLQKVFYDSSPIQRQYLASLSRTYVLLFALKAEPQIVEYFSTMSSNFNLYLGSDIIVKALSERYLEPKDQVARNLLKMAADSGVSMSLSQIVLDEVYTHIRATYWEFQNYFAEMEPYVTREIARNSGKILIRSYFYAKERGQINGWKSYINQFISYNKVLLPEGQNELLHYLLAEFGLTFTTSEELEAVTNNQKVKDLANSMLVADDKENAHLAYNTALLVHGIYGLRRVNKETTSASEFGLKTWWMTNQTRVLRHTVDLIRNNKTQYIMRPDFLLNFISLSPTCESVRENFRNTFPSVFGIQLGHRLKEGVFHDIMGSVKIWKELEPGRISALMARLSDRLKADRLRRYDQTVTEDLTKELSGWS